MLVLGLEWGEAEVVGSAGARVQSGLKMKRVGGVYIRARRDAWAPLL